MENEFCPCCGRRCPLNAPSCERGENYAKSGNMPSHANDSDGIEKPHGHGEHHHNHGHHGHGGCHRSR